DAGDGERAGSSADAFRRGDAETRSRRVSAAGFRGAARDLGARRRHEAYEREQERADGAGDVTNPALSSFSIAEERRRARSALGNPLPLRERVPSRTQLARRVRGI